MKLSSSALPSRTVAGDTHDVFRMLDCARASLIDDRRAHSISVVDVFAEDDGLGVWIGGVEVLHDAPRNQPRALI